jgi:hypothetical protein
MSLFGWDGSIGSGLIGESSAKSTPAKEQIVEYLLDVGCWMADVGCWMLDVGCWMVGGGWWMVDEGKWMLGGGC